MANRPSTVRARIQRQTRLGEMFRLYRTVRGHSLRDLAPQIGIGHATLMRIETGQTFDADTLLKLWTWMLGEDAAAIAKADPVQTADERSAS